MFAPWKRQLAVANLLYGVALLCLGILPDLPSAGISDHTAHALAYGIQAGLLSVFFLSSQSRGVSALLAAAITIFWGGVIEALQLVQSARSFEFLDLGNFNWIWFAIKTSLVIFTFQWIRWSIPRLRMDQLMDLGWKVLTPLALLWLFVTAGAMLVF